MAGEFTRIGCDTIGTRTLGYQKPPKHPITDSETSEEVGKLSTSQRNDPLQTYMRKLKHGTKDHAELQICSASSHVWTTNQTNSRTKECLLGRGGVESKIFELHSKVPTPGNRGPGGLHHPNKRPEPHLTHTSPLNISAIASTTQDEVIITSS